MGAKGDKTEKRVLGREEFRVPLQARYVLLAIAAVYAGVVLKAVLDGQYSKALDFSDAQGLISMDGGNQRMRIAFKKVAGIRKALAVGDYDKAFAESELITLPASIENEDELVVLHVAAARILAKKFALAANALARILHKRLVTAKEELVKLQDEEEIAADEDETDIEETTDGGEVEEVVSPLEQAQNDYHQSFLGYTLFATATSVLLVGEGKAKTAHKIAVKCERDLGQLPDGLRVHPCFAARLLALVSKNGLSEALSSTVTSLSTMQSSALQPLLQTVLKAAGLSDNQADVASDGIVSKGLLPTILPMLLTYLKRYIADSFPTVRIEVIDALPSSSKVVILLVSSFLRQTVHSFAPVIFSILGIKTEVSTPSLSFGDAIRVGTRTLARIIANNAEKVGVDIELADLEEMVSSLTKSAISLASSIL